MVNSWPTKSRKVWPVKPEDPSIGVRNWGEGFIRVR